ncbi:MAG TPA: AarF/UbiB family protein [Acidimicrobiales bacterium]|nr:AarF/UbiB family protein [Acidimicrobiales bacterium]
MSADRPLVLTDAAVPGGPPDAAVIRDRQAGRVPGGSVFLAGHRGLAEEAARWRDQLAPVRAAIPGRVEELTGPGRPLARAQRLVAVLIALAAEALIFCIVDWPRSWFGSRTPAQGAAHRLRRAFEHLGPSYIKLGQLISSGRGLFPDVLVDEFAVCRDRCPTLSARAVRRAVERELGSLDAHFASFDFAPLAAASIAQVHTATLHDGTSVVVKVQRPGIAREVEAHIRSMPPIARLLERRLANLPVANPTAVVTLFARTILEELDFRLEAENMVDVALDLEAAGVADVVVPRPIPGLVTARVLVMERLDGLRFDDLDEMRSAGIDTTALLLSGIRSLVEGATVFGRFHGDLHAGNILALPDGRFGLVDFGICARLDADERAGLQRLLIGIATRDVRAQVHGLDVLGALSEGTDPRSLIAKLIVSQRREADSLSVDDLRDGAPRVMKVFVDHRLDLPVALVLFFKDVLYLNGSTRLLAPDLDLLAAFAGLHDHFDDKYGAGRVVLGADPYGPPITGAELAVASGEDTPPTEAADPPSPPTVGSVGRRFGRRFLVDALVPVALFISVNSVAGLAWAMAAATTWAAGLVLLRRRAGRSTGPLVWFALGYVALRGTAGILTGSDAVYFAPGIANIFLIAGVFAASVALGRPIIGMMAPLFYPFPDEVRRHPAYRRIFGRLTVVWASFLVFTGLLQIVLLVTTTTNTYLLVRSMVAWPLAIALFVYSLRYPRRAFAREPELAAGVARTS